MGFFGVFMSKFQILGADRETGEDVELTVEAINQTEARAEAYRRGVLVAQCRSVRDVATTNGPAEPFLPPSPTTNGEIAAAPQSSVGGDILFILGYLIAIACLIMWCYLSIQIHLSNDGTAQLVWLVVTATSVWVAYDAHNNQIPVIAKRPYQPVSNGWMRWLLSCLLLWIIAFPMYLVRRSGVFAGQKPATAQPVTATGKDIESELRRFKKLLDDGLITEDEWNRRKSQILDNT